MSVYGLDCSKHLANGGQQAVDLAVVQTVFDGTAFARNWSVVQLIE